MATSTDLVKAIRSGRLADVVAALDAGAKPELDDGQGDPGLPLAVACFMGHADIARELILRGAKLNAPDNMAPTSPLSMALRGKRTEVVKMLVEMGLQVPPAANIGLSEQEIMMARLKGQQYRAASGGETEVEEISMVGCYGTDTSVLEADVMRAARDMYSKDKK